MTPVDLAAVQADDALLDMLGVDRGGVDAELVRVLVAWRRAVDARRIPELIDAGTALAAIAAATRRPPSRLRRALARLLSTTTRR